MKLSLAYKWIEKLRVIVLSLNQRRGIKLFLASIGRNRRALFLMLGFGLLSAIAEMGTIGSLGMIVGALSGDSLAYALESLGIAPAFAERATSFLDSQNNLTKLVSLAGLATVTQVFRNLLKYISKAYSIKLAIKVSNELQARATHRIMTLDYAHIGSYPSGYLNSLIPLGDVVASRLVGTVLGVGVISVIFVFFYLAVLFSLSAKAAALVVIFIMLLGFLIGFAARYLQRLSETYTNETLSLGKISVEFLNAPRLLRLFGATNYAEKIINKKRSNVLLIRRNRQLVSSLLNPAINIIVAVGGATMLVVIAMLTGEDHEVNTVFLGIYGYVILRVLPEVRSINSARVLFLETLAPLGKLGEFLKVQKEDDLKKRIKVIPPLVSGIAFENVQFVYPGATVATIEKLSFSIPRGSTVALVGPSGAGKTTIADLFLGLYRPTQGRILVDGVDLSEVNPADWLGRIGIVDQEVYLFNMSVRENIALAKSTATLSEIQKAAQLADAHEFISQLKYGYETVIGDRGYRLSGGQQQRLALARALLTDPEILVLDEATSALDSAAEQSVQEAVEKFKGVRTVLIIAHRLSTIARADDILVIKNGGVVEKGTKEELIENEDLFFKMWRAQN